MGIGDNFNKTNSPWVKLSICIVALVSILGAIYVLHNSYKAISAVLLLPSPWKEVLAIVSLIAAIILLYFIFWLKSIYPLVKKILESLRNRQSIGKTDDLGEINFYWGGRDVADSSVKKHLSTTVTNKMFIAAIGFGTIRVLADTEVVNHFTELILDRNFKITIVSPRDIEQLHKFRPEIPKENLKKNLNDGKAMLKTFEANLKGKFHNGDVNFSHHVEFRHYKDNIIPRHFVLQDDNYIFVGSYLGCTTGHKSYLMKLRRNNNHDGSKELNGLMDLFTKEIRFIINNSEIKHDE